MTPLQPSQRVRVVQTIRTREGEWTTQVEGLVICHETRPTGSWYAHGRNDRLWLQRLRLQRADGELIELVLDTESKVTTLGSPGGAPA